MEEQQAYRQAQKRVAAKFGFFIHLSAYVIVNLALVAINLMTTPQYFWFIWPLMGWGIGIAFHALATFLFFGGSSLKQRMIQKEKDRLLQEKSRAKE